MKIPKSKIFNGKRYTIHKGGQAVNISKQPQTMNARLIRYQDGEDARVANINGKYVIYTRKRRSK